MTSGTATPSLVEPVEVASGVAVGRHAWELAERPAGRVLPTAAMRLLADLHRTFEPERRRLLAARSERQAEWDAGGLPGFVRHPQAAEVAGEWSVREIPADLRRRRVEITGPVSDTKMVLNMLGRNAAGVRADCAMLDFEDSMKPDWANVVSGLSNLMGIADGTLAFERVATADRPAKTYRLDPADMPVVMVRCRGLHLVESNVEVDGNAVSGALFDLALAAFHTSVAWLGRGKTPKFYVPKVEHYREARWWEEVFSALEAALELPNGTLRATFLIETLPAAFQVEEILFELRNRAAGLNVGRWDKIFSDIKVLKEHPDRVTADRASITMQRPWMRDYARHLIRACHRHGAWAMGGMAAFTPGRSSDQRRAQEEKVVSDKRWEAELGHDGCWVSHPYFIGPALAAFERDDQLEVIPELPARPDLLPRGGGPRTAAGLATNVRVAIAYTEGWSRGIGCVAWDDLMEDLATLEISRAQVWQWLRHGAALDDGSEVTHELVHAAFAEELARILEELPPDPDTAASFRRAADEAARIFTEKAFRPFLATASAPAGAPTQTQ